MQILYNNHEYADMLIEVAQKYPTYYAWGAFGAPASYGNSKIRYKVPNAPDNSFLFDCSGFAYKALPWGWYGDRNRAYGGATYMKKGYEELETNNILGICKDVSADFNSIQMGEVLYMEGHVGVYIGNGRAVECTSKWTNGCLFSEVQNCGINTGLPYKRTWLKHGKLPFVDYVAVPSPVPDDDKKEQQIAKINEIRKNLDELEMML